VTFSDGIARRTLGVLAVTALAAAPASARPARRVDVGGYRLNLHCVGEGAPTVVLDAGAGDSSETWDWVVPGVREFTRVCVYDRAGLGRSDPGPMPRTSERIAVELKALLSRAGIRGPYVLAGHSFGGLNMRLYAALHPDEVAGLVLVDATPEDFPAREQALRTRDESEKLLTAKSIASPALRAELDAMLASVAAVRAAPQVGADVIVISAAHPAGSAQFVAVWAELQEKMVSRFPHANQVIAEQSGHYIQYDEPDLIVNALRELVFAARMPKPQP
jgi:pimeloyl-ACP methyl ester carboxylesterase